MLSYFQDLKEHQIIVLDANFIFIPAQFGIDYIEEIKNIIPGKLAFVIFKLTLTELYLKQSLKPHNPKFQSQLDLGLQILKSQDYYEIPLDREEGKKVDEHILNACKELVDNDFRVHLATNDKRLRMNAVSRGINTIYMRQKKKIVTDRYD